MGASNSSTIYNLHFWNMCNMQPFQNERQIDVNIDFDWIRFDSIRFEYIWNSHSFNSCPFLKIWLSKIMAIILFYLSTVRFRFAFTSGYLFTIYKMGLTGLTAEPHFELILFTIFWTHLDNWLISVVRIFNSQQKIKYLFVTKVTRSVVMTFSQWPFQ